MALYVDVAIRTEELAARSLDGRCVVALDVLRATSTIVTALGAGAREVHPVEHVDDARAKAEELRTRGANVLLCGDRNSLPPEGFDLGNSPREYTPDIVSGKTLVLTTTNGTRLLEFCSAPQDGGRPAAVWIGAFLNRTAVANALLEEGKPVLLACAGTEGQFSLDDFCGAGSIVGILARRTEAELTDAAVAAMELFLLHDARLPAFMERTYHGARLVKTGLQEDIPVCTQLDAVNVLPVFEDGVIRPRP